MKKSIFILFSLISIVSCSDLRENSVTYFIIKNESECKIDLFVTGYADPNRPGVYRDTILSINNNESLINSYNDYNPSSAYPFPFGSGADSVSITFNDTITMSYSRDDTNLRNPLIFENYTGGEVKEGRYEYYYTITEEDYESALANY